MVSRTYPGIGLVAEIVGMIDPMECFGEMPSDPVLFKVACEEAAKAVPMDEMPRGAFAREKYARERLWDAVQFRNRFYRNNLKPLRTN